MPRQTRDAVKRMSTSNSNPVLTTNASTNSSISAGGDNSLPEGSTSSSYLANLAKEPRTKGFRCDRCSRTFTRRENLTRHANSHDYSKYHQCGICGKGFSRRDLLSRHQAGHKRWDQQSPSARRSHGPRKRRKAAFEDDATSSADTAGPTPELGEREGTERQIWSPNLHQTGSPGFTKPPDVSTSSGYQFCHLTGPQPTIIQHSPNSFAQMPPPQQLLYDNGHELGSTNRRDHFSHLPSAHEDIPSPLTSFDFSAFLLPHKDGESSEFSHEWFSNDFYSAMKETGNEDVEFNEMLNLTFQSPVQFNQYSIGLGEAHLREQGQNSQRETASAEHIGHQPESLGQAEPGRISRISSPPNEASEEDKWAFAWNPRSRPIFRANPVKIPDNHPLRKNHNAKFDITESTFRRVQAFINPVIVQGFARSHLELPSLSEVNILINLFFERFSPQAPVLHHSTVDTNDDLPPPLLVAMIVIGAIHSRLPGSRRFSIVLLDMVRWNLQTAIECDNALMREPMIIFAEALVCHAGLWCGNKRAFELAEVVRSMAVKHVRRAQFWRESANPIDREKGEGHHKVDTKDQWQSWIAKESQKRLFWVIYALDAQCAGLLYLPATFAIGEVRNLCCPCDDEFWSAQSARHWKSLLGDATVPPSRTFSAAMAPFAQSFAPLQLRDQTFNSTSRSLPRSPLSPILNLNAWSAFLVLATLQVQIFNFSQERLFARSIIIQEDSVELDTLGESLEGTGYDEGIDVSKNLQRWQKVRRESLLDSLTLWEHTYLSNHSWQDRYPTSIYFRHASRVCHPICLIVLDVSMSDLQNAIGKEGSTGIPEAMSNLHHWVQTSPRLAEDIAYTATKTITTPLSILVPKVLGPTACEQTTIAVFLCYVLVWIFASVAGPLQKQSLLARLAENEELWKSPQLVALRQALEFCEERSGPRVEGSPILSKKDVLGNIFRSAAQSLTHLGTWGAALDMALLLHRRAEMQ